MFAKEDDTEEKKKAMKVLRLGRKKKRKEKPIAAFVFKNPAIDKNPMEGCSRVFKTRPKPGL